MFTDVLLQLIGERWWWVSLKFGFMNRVERSCSACPERSRGVRVQGSHFPA